MSIVKPFICVRPEVNYVEKVAALPYDVYNREEACSVVAANPLSFLNIDRPETQFDNSVDTYDKRVYLKAKELLDKMIKDKILIEDKEKAYYVYSLTMNGRSQTGIVATPSIDDYLNNVIKKHENTRADKEIDRINHVDITSAQTGPIFLAYRANQVINNEVNKIKLMKPLYSFISDDLITHQVWKICEKSALSNIEDAFSKINDIYIADGHHRCASAVKVGLKRRSENKEYTGMEDFNYFLAVLFPDEELMIMDYNRVVKDLNSNSPCEFIDKLNKSFNVIKVNNIYKPDKKGFFGMYLDNSWYKLEAKDIIKSTDPVKGLDVSLLQDYLLNPILGITDPKTDKRIDFVGGIRGLKELELRCNIDMKVAFAMYPTSIKELFDVADSNLLMPPKSTWFEPKLRSGIFIHKI